MCDILCIRHVWHTICVMCDIIYIRYVWHTMYKTCVTYYMCDVWHTICVMCDITYVRYVWHNTFNYGVARISRIDKIIGLFCRMSSLLYGSFAKETYAFNFRVFINDSFHYNVTYMVCYALLYFNVTWHDFTYYDITRDSLHYKK